ncbi:serine hydrolase domain-containing protein [Streptomyces sp. NPDC004752]
MDLARAALAADEKLPSLSVAIGVGRELIAEWAWGSANAERSIEATPETAYLLASITKPITATIVALLAAEGRLRFDMPVDRILGYKLPTIGAVRQPTIAELLGHRAGLGRFYRFFYADEARARLDSIRSTIERHGVVAVSPGISYEYSNLGYGILDEVIARVTGSDPAEVALELVAAPLALGSLSIGAEYTGGSSNTAERYGADKIAYPIYDVEHRGGTLAWATAGDLARFGLAAVPGGAFAGIDHVRALQHKPDNLGDYGLGWDVTEVGGASALGHSGGMGGVSTKLLCVPAAQLSVAVLSNVTGSSTAVRLADQIAAFLLSGGTLLDSQPRKFTEQPSSDGPTPDDLVGSWRAEVITEFGELVLQAEFGERETAIIINRAERVTASIFKPGSYAVRMAGQVSDMTGSPIGRGRTIMLQLRRIGSDLAGLLTLTQPAGAGLVAANTEGGAPGIRVGDCVCYPIQFSRERPR